MELAPLLVLAAGSCLGGFMRGLAGFGGAIMNLCVWVVCSTAGVNAGTLQQAVMVECISGEAAAVPLLYLTDVCTNANWALVVSLLVFGGIGSAIGAALLIGLNARVVQLIMAIILLVVILLHCKVPSHMYGWLLGLIRSRRQYHQLVGTDVTDAAAPVKEDSADSIAVPVQHSVASMNMAGQCELNVQPHDSGDGSSDSNKASMQAGDATAADDGAVTVCIGSVSETAKGQQHQQRGELELQQHKAPQQLECAKQLHQQQQRRTWREAWHKYRQSEHANQLVHMLGLGSIAGIASGIMAGLTGMGGPPLMYFYTKLALPKDVVRSCNAVLGVLQPRIVAYAAMGAFQHDDLPIYGIATAVALAGMLCGNYLAQHVNQAAFSKLLVGLMLVCCALMFASAAGLVA